MVENYNKVSVFIRADASTRIGTGHIMRCLTFADELKIKGVNVNFICCNDTGNLIGLIKKKGYTLYDLPADVDLDLDIEICLEVLKSQPVKADWLIVDNYSLDSRFETRMRPYAEHIMVIDDMADRSHDCDLLLDQNLCTDIETRYDRLVSSCCRKLIGPRYALLRPEFSDFREGGIERNSSVKRILIFMGGSDPTNQTYKALKAVQLLELPEIALDVVVGDSNPHKEEIKRVCSALPRAAFHCQVDNMAQLMVKADLAIGASGATSWERCCLGLPTIVLILSDNQRNIAEKLEEKAAVTNLGWYKDVKEYHIRDAIKELIDDFDKRKNMGLRGMEIVNAEGRKRVAIEILNYGAIQKTALMNR